MIGRGSDTTERETVALPRGYELTYNGGQKGGRHGSE